MAVESRELASYRALPRDDGTGVPAGSQATEESRFRDYWRIIRKRAGLITVVFGVAVVASLVVTISATRLYEGTATIQIERQVPKVAPVHEVQQVDPSGSYWDKYDYYETQFEILKSHAIVARVIKKLRLDQNPYFRDAQPPGLIRRAIRRLRGRRPAAKVPAMELGVEADLIGRYLGFLTIDPVRRSRLVRVTYASPSPELAAEIANEHVRQYIEASLAQRLETTLQAKTFLEREIVKAKTRADQAEASLNQFRRDKRILSLGGDKSDLVAGRLDDLNHRLSEAQADRIRLESVRDLVERQEYESLPQVMGSALIAQLKQELGRVEAERAEVARRFEPTYPKLAELVAREDQLRQRLGGEVEKIALGIRAEYGSAKVREEQLDRELSELRDTSLTQQSMDADYATLARDLELSRGLYASLMQRLKDIDVAGEIKASNVSVVDWSPAPQSPSQPQALLNLLASAIVGLTLGCVLAAMRERLDDTLEVPDDVERSLGLPTVGIVPSFIPLGSSRWRSALVRAATASPRLRVGASDLIGSKSLDAVIVEAYRTLRTAILLSSADNPPQVLLFTSAQSGEGKTVTAVNEAIVLAQAGARVLLIDADMRKPRLHRLFTLPNGNGLSTYLSGQTRLESCLHRVAECLAANPSTLGGSLAVLTAGPASPNPGALLGSRRMRETIGLLREQFDYIVIDTPPVLPVSDALMLAAMSDGVILVVRGATTPRQMVIWSRDRLEQARANLLGVVLNDIDVRRGDYARYYRDYYAYTALPGQTRSASV